MIGELQFYWWELTHFPHEFFELYLVSAIWLLIKIGIAVWIIRFVLRMIKKRTQPISSDGHRVKQSENHTFSSPKHAAPKQGPYASRQDPLPQYIVHEEPEEGYVILNGHKVRKEDLKYK